MNSHYFSRFIFGLVLILVGSAFLLDQLNIIPSLDFGELFRLYWPVILIVFGLKGLMFNKSLRYGWIGSVFWNFVIILIGAYFLARNLGWIYFDIRQLWKFALPAFLILIGASILFRSPHRHRRPWSEGCDWTGDGNDEGSFKGGSSENPYAERRRRAEERRAERHYWHNQRRERHRMRRDDWQPGNGQPNLGPDDLGQTRASEQPNGGAWQQGANRTDRSGFVGDIFLGGDYWELKPTNVSHFIGDTTIDLTKAAIPHGVTPIQVSAFIGDVKIYVPNDADIAISVSSSVFMGELQVLNRYESGMFKSMKEESAGYELADKKIKINISMFIGDIVVIQVG
jgi:lia operon protein LiaF